MTARRKASRAVVALVVCSLFAGVAAPRADASSRWQPAGRLSWQMQFNGRIDISIRADVYGLDMFDTPSRIVRRLHDRGRRVVCYINAGAWEEWRPDAAAYPAQVKGSTLDGWPGEKWLDIRRIDVLGPIISHRLRMCRDKGFDGVEFDNVDGYSNRSGFALTADDQLAFNRWLAAAAHEFGLAVGLKNTLDLAAELEPVFDFAILEQCAEYRECGRAAPFLDAGKPVLDIEYSVARSMFCPRAGRLGMFAMRKRLELDAWRRAC